jgi:hypothetical protein
MLLTITDFGLHADIYVQQEVKSVEVVWTKDFMTYYIVTEIFLLSMREWKLPTKHMFNICFMEAKECCFISLLNA